VPGYAIGEPMSWQAENMHKLRWVVLVAAAVLPTVACSGTVAVPGSPSPAPVVASTPTPAGVAAPAPPPVVVLDPGHNAHNGTAAARRLVPDGRGGQKACNTTGTSTDAGYPEHAFTFDVAQRVATKLEAAGVRVVLTRPDDDGVGPCVDERGRAGEVAGAAATVSIHADGAAPSSSGFHVAYSDPPLNPVQAGPAHDLATDLRDALRSGGFRDSDYIGRAGLSPRSDLAGLNHATRPTALVECANMRNPHEAGLVSSPDGRGRYAGAIADGVLAFLGLKH
jgi:N-acetylmuramoyl-L-alanine amidase